VATRAEVLEKLKTAASEGNIREAYREFEELPIVDQLAISVSPGVGDALAVYEVGEFAQRGSESLEEDEFLGALGNYGLSALAAASLIPIFRFFRGARAVKAAPTEEIKLLPDLEPTKVVEKATKDVPVPKVEEFKPLSLDEQMYPGTMFDNKAIEGAGQVLTNKGLTSKAAKFVNTSKKLPNQGKAQAFINAIKKSGVPEGEMRLLNLIDETGEIHPKLMSELEIRNPQGKITRQRLANYIKSNQQGALSRRRINENQFAGQIDTSGTSAVKENTYHVRGLDRKGRFDHYSSIDEHKDNFVFDSIADLDLRAIDNIDDQIRDLVKDFVGGNSLLNVARIQSDYAEELGELASKNKDAQVTAIMTSNEFRDVVRNLMDPEFDAFYEGGTFARDAILATARQAPDLSPSKLKDKLLKDMLDDKTPVGKLYKMELDESDDFADVDIGSLIKPEYFERLIPAVKKAQADFPLTPYVDSKKIAALKKGLNEYNQNVPKVNKLAQDKFKIQNELKASGLTPGSPSYLRVSDELAEIDKQIADLVPPESFGNFSGFTLTKADLEQATGKPFTESLGKSVDEIFYDLEYLRGGNTGPIRQKYGPGTPEERALKYFNEMVNNTEQTFDIGNGLGILKKATKINPDLLKGYAIDPYAKGARSDVTKFPIRSNFLRAVTEGKDGMYLDSATKRLGKEGGSQYDILQTTYKEAENEIAKIIKELGEDPKKYVRTFNKVDADLDGTYVKIDDEIRKLVIDKGVDAFKDGGPVNIENMLANL
jgi:Txe/YoeB family toxin of Txe-Axe toxin-antitoxin module